MHGCLDFDDPGSRRFREDGGATTGGGRERPQMNSDRSSYGGHLDDDAIQGLLDAAEGRVDAAAEAARGHLARCAGCRARVDAWREMFGELGQLRRFAPPGRFAERVMSGIELTAEAASPSRARLWARLRRWPTRPAANAHLSGRRLQELADGALSRKRAALVKAHLATCARCESRLTGWRRLIVTLETLPPLAPAAGFAERVMARWRAMADESAGRNRAARARRPWPRSPRGWALAGTLTSVPIAAVTAAAAFVSTVPQLTTGGLVTYLWWQTRDALSAFGGSLLSAVMQSGAAFRAYALADYLIASPATAAAGAAAFSTLTLSSVWVLRRNLVSPRFALRHAHN